MIVPASFISTRMFTTIRSCCSQIPSDFMRRDVDRTASLRTGYISRDAVSDGLQNRRAGQRTLEKVGTANKVILHCIVSQWITKS